jgi:hypothetical protein
LFDRSCINRVRVLERWRSRSHDPSFTLRCHFIVRGMLISSAHAQAAALIPKRSNCAPASSLDPEMVRLSFGYAITSKISAQRLLPGSTVRFKEAMYWEKRRELILGRSPVFRAGPNWNASHGRRQRAEPGPRSKGPSDIAHRFICSGSALMEEADQGGVCRRHARTKLIRRWGYGNAKRKGYQTLPRARWLAIRNRGPYFRHGR